jgi:hypothetical protein
MPHRHLVVFEDERVCRDAVTFAREYCLRMGSGVALLMLVALRSSDAASLGNARNVLHTARQGAGKLLDAISEEFTSHQIAVSTTLRVGDPRRELIKFLAERPPFSVVIWGSDESLPGRDQRGHVHWMEKAAETLECPLYAVSHKALAHGTPDEEA